MAFEPARVMPPLTSFRVSHFVLIFISLKGMSMKNEQSFSLSDHSSQAITAFPKSLRQHRLVPFVSSKTNKGFNENVFRSLSSSPNEKQGWSGSGRNVKQIQFIV